MSLIVWESSGTYQYSIDPVTPFCLRSINRPSLWTYTWRDLIHNDTRAGHNVTFNLAHWDFTVRCYILKFLFRDRIYLHNLIRYLIIIQNGSHFATVRTRRELVQSNRRQWPYGLTRSGICVKRTICNCGEQWHRQSLQTQHFANWKRYTESHVLL